MAGPSLLVGVFVGGSARRMGGIAKGLLPTADGRSVVGRLLDVTREALPGASIVLVGSSASYDALAVPSLADTPSGVGPLGGLRALLAHAEALGFSHALALACDMPLISASLLQRLGEVEPRALAVAPREPGGKWYAMSARYALEALPAIDTLLANDERRLQRLFALLGTGARELSLSEGELALLKDWDRPEDLG